MRIFLPAACLAVGVAVAMTGMGRAQNSAPTGAPGRYAIAPAGDGFVRIDTQTGMVSECARREGRFLCEPALESSGEVFSALTGFGQRLDAMREEVARLSAEVVRLRERTETLDRVTLKVPAKLSPEEEKEAERVAGVTDQMFRRLFGLVAEIKRSENK